MERIFFIFINMKELLAVIKDSLTEEIANSVYESVRKMGGVESVRIFIKSGVISVIYDGASTLPEKIISRIEGFNISVDKFLVRDEFKSNKEINISLNSGILKVLMFLSIIMIFYYSEKFNTNRYISVLVYLISIFFIYRDMILISKRLKKKLFIFPLTFIFFFIIGIFGIFNLFFPSYFQPDFFSWFSVFIFVFVVAGCFYISEYILLKNSISILAEFSYFNRYLNIFKNDSLNKIAAININENDTVVFNSGDFVVADGVIEEGQTTVDESLVRGETSYIHLKKGDRIVSGSFIVDGTIKVTSEKSTLNSFFFQKIKNAVKKINIFEDSFIYIPFVVSNSSIKFIFIPIIILVIYSFYKTDSLNNIVQNFFISFMVTYPYALWLVFPVVYFFCISSGIKRGFFVKNISIIEKIRNTDTLVVLYCDGIDPKTIFDFKKNGIKTVLLCADSKADKNIVDVFDEYHLSLTSDEKQGFVIRMKTYGSNIMAIGNSVADLDALSEADVRIIFKKHPESFSLPCDIILFKNDLKAVNEIINYSFFIDKFIKSNAFFIMFFHFIILPLVIFFFPSINCRFLIYPVIFSIIVVMFNSIKIYFVREF